MITSEFLGNENASTPISNALIVIGKWGACYVFFMLIALVAFGFPLVLIVIFPEQGFNLGFYEREVWIGNGIFITIFGASFTSIGVFASSLTKNQMVAGMLTFTLLTGFSETISVFKLNPSV